MVRKAVIFGASGGIGKEVVEALRNAGWITFTKRIDVTNIEEIIEYAKELTDVELMVYCVGVMNTNSVEEIDINTLKNIFDVNLFGAINVTKVLLPVMKDNTHFIFISSLRAQKSSMNRLAYCSSKAGLDMFASVLRKETRKNVTVIRPGYVDTKLHKDKQLYPYYSDVKIPVTKASDIALSILFILNLSEGAKIKELNIGEVYNGKEGICFMEEK